MSSRRTAPLQKQLAASSAILVLGMHRSGTSALARVLNLRGADLGRELLAPKDDNEAGFWENSAILALHEKLLAQLGATWHDAGIPGAWLDSEPAHEFQRDLGIVLREQFGDSRLLLVKDPRLSLLVPLWIDVLRAQGVQPAFVIMARDPAEVAASLARRDGFSAAKSNLLWLEHMHEAERATRGQTRVFVHYARLLTDWRQELARIEERLQLALPQVDMGTSRAIESFLKPQLRHHRHPASPDGQPRLLQRFYATLTSACAADRDVTKQFQVLDAEFDGLREISQPLIREQWTQLAKERADHAAEVEQARRVIDGKQGEIEQARKIIDGKQDEIEQARRIIADKQSEIDQARQIIEGKQGEIEQARAGFAQKDDQIEAARRQIDALVADIDRAARAYAQKEQELDAARRNIDNLGGEIAQARAAHEARDKIEAQLRADLQRAAELDAQKDRELEAARRNIDELADHIEQARRAQLARDEVEAGIARVPRFRSQ